MGRSSALLLFVFLLGACKAPPESPAPTAKPRPPVDPDLDEGVLERASIGHEAGWRLVNGQQKAARPYLRLSPEKIALQKVVKDFHRRVGDCASDRVENQFEIVMDLGSDGRVLAAHLEVDHPAAGFPEDFRQCVTAMALKYRFPPGLTRITVPMIHGAWPNPK